MSMKPKRLVLKVMNSLAAGAFGLLACGAVHSQGIAFVDDYQAASPTAGNGLALPVLRNRMTSPPNNGMHRAGSMPMRGQAHAQVHALPREMLAEATPTDTAEETSTGLIPKMKRFSLLSIFGDTPSEQAMPQEQPARDAMPGARQRGTTFVPKPQPQPEVEPAPPARFSLKRLFGDEAATAPPQQKRVPTANSTLVGIPSERNRPLFGRGKVNEPGIYSNAKGVGIQDAGVRGNATAASPPVLSQPAAPSPEAFATPSYRARSQQQPEIKRVSQQQQLQREQSPARALQDSAAQQDFVARPAVASERSNGLQLRPTGNRPAGLFDNHFNESPQAQQVSSGNSLPSRAGMARVPQTSANNAFSRGPETLERLAQNGQTPAAGGPHSQPVFVSDNTPMPKVTAPVASPAKRPLITAVSPEMRQQGVERSFEMPASRIAVSQPAPLVIENRARQSSPQPSLTAKNPVPPKTEATVAPAATPSPRAIELLTEANALAGSAKTEEQLTQVVQMCRQVLAIDNSPPAVQYSKQLGGWALNRRGESRTDAGRDNEALLDFEDAVHTDPTQWRAVHNRGVLLAQQGQFGVAFDDFNRTVELNPAFAKAYSNRAALYVQAGDLAAALDDYRRAISLDPDLAVAHKGRGRVCHMLGNFEEALQHYDAAVLLAEGDAHIELGRADLLADMGRYAAATEGYQQTIALDPALDTAYRSLAWVQATCPEESFRDAEQALLNAEQALHHAGQEDDLALDTLAAAQANAGDFAAAQATQQRAIALAPAGERTAYQQRLELYQANQPFRTDPPQPIRQATYRR